MQYFTLIVTVIGFIILGWYQRYYIRVLERQIKSQKDILDSQNETIKNMKMFVDIFQPEKIHEFVKMREVTFEDRKNKDIEKIKSEMEKDSKKKSDALKFVFEEFVSLLKIVFNLTYYVHPESRKAAIENSPNSQTKTSILIDINNFPYYGDVYANALRKALIGKVALSHPAKPETKH